MLDVALLGTGGMMPLPNRFLTSLLCRINGRLIMIDCGEGTQVTCKLLGWGFKHIDAICFTHFHADHISGLPGILLTIGNAGRSEAITLIGPKGLAHVVSSLLVIAPELPFPIHIQEWDNAALEPFKIGQTIISAYPMEHGIPCYGYRLDIPRPGKFDPKKATAIGLPKNMWSQLQQQLSVEYEGKTYESSMVMGPLRKGIRLTYCTDSRPVPGLSDFVAESDLFICEGIYGDNEKIPKAIQYRHMVFSEAAAIAREGCVKELWLTHYSPSMTYPEEFLATAQSIFPNTILGKDRMTKNIPYDNDGAPDAL